MKAKVCLIVLFTSLFSIFSFTAQAADMTQSQTADAQIIKTLMVLNSNEIAAAKVALKNTSNANVRKFAQGMIKAHSKNLQATKALAAALKISPVASDKSNNLQKDGQDELAKLQTLKNKDFDQEYMNAMVNGHADALKMFDNDFLPNASNPKLKNLLAATRPVIAQHLQMAQATQKTLS